jgi:hypothetical protein
MPIQVYPAIVILTLSEAEGKNPCIFPEEVP